MPRFAPRPAVKLATSSSTPRFCVSERMVTGSVPMLLCVVKAVTAAGAMPLRKRIGLRCPTQATNADSTPKNWIARTT